MFNMIKNLWFGKNRKKLALYEELRNKSTLTGCNNCAIDRFEKKQNRIYKILNEYYGLCRLSGGIDQKIKVTLHFEIFLCLLMAVDKEVLEYQFDFHVNSEMYDSENYYVYMESKVYNASPYTAEPYGENLGAFFTLYNFNSE